MNNPDKVPGFSQKSNFNPNDLLVAFRTKADIALNDLQKKLKTGLQQEYEVRLNKLKIQLDNYSNEAIASYDREMKEIEQYKDIPVLFEASSESIKDTLEGTLRANEQLLQQFIASCQNLLS